MRAGQASDGVVRTPGPVRARVLAAVAVVLVAVLGIAGFIALRPEPPPSAGLVDPSPQDDRNAGEAPVSAPLGRAVLKALPPPESEPEPEPEEDDSDESQEVTIDQLPAGDGTGLDVFPRPGTKPIQRGLIVPEGFQLPPGFVRHHQTADTGEQLPPILKFHPDHVPPGAPADRIVPPELAPSNMPQKWLEPPPPKSKQ